MDHSMDQAGVHNASAHGPGHDHASHSMDVECDGSLYTFGHGTWMGHFYPGLAFCVWGAWWAYNVCAYWLFQTPRRPYRGRAWWPLALRGLWYLEPVLKLLVPLVAISFELLLDHGMEYRYLFCPKGTKYEGRFALTHMNNWSHTASYYGVVLSGLTDLAGEAVPLPPGTGEAVLGVGWATQAFIMATHEKHEPQDKMVHWLLYVAQALVALLLFADLAARRRSVLAGLGRALAVVFQGAWLIQIAFVEFGDRPQWSKEYSGGAMMAPVAFTSILLTALAALLLLYTAMALGRRSGLLTPRRLALPLDGEADQGYAKPGDVLHMAHHGYGPAHASHRHCDSARHSVDSEEEQDSALELSAAVGGHFGAMHGRGAAKDGAVELV